MKTCPFCREDAGRRQDEVPVLCVVPDPPQPGPESTAATPAPGPDQAVYIVNKSLIRFGKFVGAVLTIFTLVGGVIWGFKIDTAADKVRDAAEVVQKAQADVKDMQLAIRESQDQVQKTNQKILDAAASVETNRKLVESTRQEVQEFLAKAQGEAQELFGAIQKDKGQADSIITVLVQRTGPGLRAAPTLRSPSPEAAPAPFVRPGNREIVRLPDRIRREGSNDRTHRTGRRVFGFGPGRLLRPTESSKAQGHVGLCPRRPESAGHGGGFAGHPRYRDRGCSRPRCPYRRLLRPEHRCGFR